LLGGHDEALRYVAVS